MSGLFAGTSLERPVTCERCQKPLEECTCPRNAAGRVVLPSEQPVRVRRQKRRHKMVTLVEGLDPVASDLKAIAKTLRLKCGAGGTVSEDVVEVQGDHVPVVMEVLREMGFRPR